MWHIDKTDQGKTPNINIYGLVSKYIHVRRFITTRCGITMGWSNQKKPKTLIRNFSTSTGVRGV